MTQVLYHISPQVFIGEGQTKVLTDVTAKNWLGFTATPQSRNGTKHVLKIKIPGGRRGQAVDKWTEITM
jgi:hypothetical protein